MGIVRLILGGRLVIGVILRLMALVEVHLKVKVKWQFHDLPYWEIEIPK